MTNHASVNPREALGYANKIARHLRNKNTATDQTIEWEHLRPNRRFYESQYQSTQYRGWRLSLAHSDPNISEYGVAHTNAQGYVLLSTGDVLYYYADTSYGFDARSIKLSPGLGGHLLLLSKVANSHAESAANRFSGNLKWLIEMIASLATKQLGSDYR